MSIPIHLPVADHARGFTARVGSGELDGSPRATRPRASRVGIVALVARAAVGVALAIALIMAVAAPASAASCYGDYCSGRDPQATGCSADAYTVAHSRIPGTSANVELRWSPSCKTNWARTTWHGSDLNSLRAVQCPTGYTQAGVVGDNGTYVWTRQIYSPRMGVAARWLGAPGPTSTACA